MINKRGMGFGAIVTMILGIVVIIGVSVAVVKNIKTVGEQLIGIEPEKKDEKDLEEGFKPILCEKVTRFVDALIEGITKRTEFYEFAHDDEITRERITNALINCYDDYYELQGDQKLCAVFDLRNKPSSYDFIKTDLRPGGSISTATIGFGGIAGQSPFYNFMQENKNRYIPAKSIENVVNNAKIFAHSNTGEKDYSFLCLWAKPKKVVHFQKCKEQKTKKPICPLDEPVIIGQGKHKYRMEKAPCKPIEDFMSLLPAKKKQVEIYSLEVTKTVNFKNHEKLLNAVVNCYDKYKENKDDPTNPTIFSQEQICAIFDMRIDPYVNLREEDFKTIVNDIKNKYDKNTKTIIEEAIKKLSFENKEGLVRDAKEPFFCVKIFQGNTKIGKCERQGTLRIVLKGLEPTVPIDEQVCKTKENFQMKLTTTT